MRKISTLFEDKLEGTRIKLIKMRHQIDESNKVLWQEKLLKNDLKTAENLIGITPNSHQVILDNTRTFKQILNERLDLVNLDVLTRVDKMDKLKEELNKIEQDFKPFYDEQTEIIKVLKLIEEYESKNISSINFLKEIKKYL